MLLQWGSFQYLLEKLLVVCVSELQLRLQLLDLVLDGLNNVTRSHVCRCLCAVHAANGLPGVTGTRATAESTGNN